MVKNLPAGDADVDLIPGLGRSPGEGNGSPSQCSAREIPWTESLVGHSPRSHKESDKLRDWTAATESRSETRRSFLEHVL